MTLASWIDDSYVRDARFAQSVRRALEAADAVVTDAADGDDRPGVLLLDAVDDDVLGAVARASAAGRRRVLVLAQRDAALAGDAAWRLLSLGAADVRTWAGPETARDVVARLARWAAVDEVLGSAAARDRLVGTGPAWRAALREAVEAAMFGTGPVLLSGESGTGKELVARLVHRLDPRPDRGGLVVVDCTTVVPTLSGSEFFGHERGAFTGAVSAREGAFAAADGGTLFLDEIGELPPPLQAELLRVVQEGTYKRVGGNVWRTTSFRLVCATNRDLLAEVAAGRFRRDLYYRIAASTVRLPPLRDRREDVLPLFRHFLAELRGGAAPAVHPAVADVLRAREYDGNVRDLRQLALRVHARHVGEGPVTPGDLPPEEWPHCAAPEPVAYPDLDLALDDPIRRALARGMTFKQVRDAAASAAIRVAVEEADGNLRRAAARLGVTDRALQLRRARSDRTD